MPDLSHTPVTREQLVDMYRRMLLIRRFEEQAARAYQSKKILGFCHLYIGQEAVAVGASAALRPTDVVVAAYREHGQILARGADPNAVMAELFGRATGVSHGIGGSMHLVSREHHFWGGYGIVGGHVPLAVGAAFAARYRDEDSVSLVYFGDGAAQQGAFYESLALAQLWSLPVVFLCENNRYAMGTSVERASYLQDMSKRGDGVGMKGWQFEGYDVVDVFHNLETAVTHARSGQGPVILEAQTYRYRGHSMSDPAKYRREGELDLMQHERDGLLLAEARLKAEHGVTDDEIAAWQTEAKGLAKTAYDTADAAPEPDLAHLYDYTYAE